MPEQNDTDEALARSVLRDLGFLGSYLYSHSVGRLGKHRVLLQLQEAGGTCLQRELQQCARISSASLCETLSKLCDEGLIERKRSDKDHRQLDISLTEAGRKQALVVKKEIEAFEATCLSSLDEDEQRTLLSLLDRLTASWRQSENGG